MTEPQTDKRERLARMRGRLETLLDKTPEEVRELIASCLDQFLHELDGLTETQVAFSPGESEWSVKEVCLHVSNATTATAGAIGVLAQGTTIPPMGKDIMGKLDSDPGGFDEIRANVERGFEKSVKALGLLEGDFDADATFTHPIFGALNCREMAVFNIMHMNVHVAQLKRIKGTDGFPA